MAPIVTPEVANIIAKIIIRTCIDDDDVEVIEEILQGTLHEYYAALEEYFVEEYYNAVSIARSRAYDAGYEAGYEAGHSESHSAV